MSSQPGDAWIDDELRNVAVPPALLPKLHAIASLDDAELDQALRDVAAPPGLFDRLRSIGTLDEVDVDDELRHVVVPISLAARVRRIPMAVRRSKRTTIVLRRVAIAASLLLAAGIGYLAAVSPSFFGGPRQETAANRTEPGPSTSSKQQPRTRPTTPPVSSKSEHPELVRSATSPNTESDAEDTVPVTAPPLPSPPQLAGDKSGPTPRSATETDADSWLTGVLASGLAADRLPQLESLPTPVWRGLTPPRVRGYDLMFQLRHGVHPFVSPAANPALETCPVPLATTTASFDAALALSAERKLPPPSRIRTEEFLAAMDYGFAAPESSALGLRTAIGPSPFGMPGASLLQVAAQARSVSPSNQAPRHVVAILDRSISMRWEERWQTAVLGLRKYVERMAADDRLSIVLMAERAEIVAENQSAAKALETLASLSNQPSAKAVNLVDAVEMANEVIGRGSSQAAGYMVLVTDGELQLNDPVNQRHESAIQAVTGQGHRFEVLDLRQEQAADPELAQVASASGGKAGSSGAVVQANTPDAIRWKLLEIAEGTSQVVATNAAMKVTFKPDAVAMYRLLGHEATSFGVLIDATVEAEIHSGEAATGLFELILKPDAGETIATVELTWRDPQTDAVETRRQTVSRLQLAPSFHQSPLSLQMAALAAQTADVLRNSYFSPAHANSLQGVAQLAAQLNPRLQERPTFVRLMKLVEQAQRSQVVSP